MNNLEISKQLEKNINILWKKCKTRQRVKYISYNVDYSQYLNESLYINILILVKKEPFAVAKIYYDKSKSEYILGDYYPCSQLNQSYAKSCINKTLNIINKGGNKNDK